MFHVDSEVGRLRQVVLHRPELELKRLTPDNASELLFDGVLWAERAQAEHDEFAEALVARGVAVHYYGGLLTQTLEISQAREYIMDRVFDSRLNGPLACAALRAAVEGLPSPVLAQALTGGITKQEILELTPEPKSIAFHSLEAGSFVLAPLPNLLYQRDTSSWIYGGVSVNAMAMPARMRETVNDEAIYRWHPMFAGGSFEVWYHGADAAPATIEGGDILVIGNGAVLAGMSERTTPQAVELIAHRLFSAGAARCLVAIDMPKARAFMHLDTVMTMCDYGVFTKYMNLGMLPSYTVEPGRQRPRAEGHRPSAGGHAHRDRGRARPAQHQGADRQPGPGRRAARAVGRRLQRAGHRAGRGRRLRPQRHHERVPGAATASRW